MAIKDVTNLRREGKLKEALDLAVQEHNEDPNAWTKMSLFWVYRDMALNLYLPANNIDDAKECLNKMQGLLPEMMDDNGAGEKAYQNLFKRILPNADSIRSAYELSKTDPNTAYNDVTSKFGCSGKDIDEALHEEFGWIIYRYIKSNLTSLQSVEVRSLLRDYMLLKNERPSMLHSMIINFALNFYKSHTDFNFYNFFKMWGIDNLRYDDYRDSHVDGHDIPSLVSRICKAIVETGVTFDVVEFVGEFDHQDEVVEHLRQAYFWKLMDMKKNNSGQNLWETFNTYAVQYPALGASHWHSEILKIAYRFMSEDNAFRFWNFMKLWYGNGNITTDDWKKETGTDGQEYSSLASKSIKRCFEIAKSDANLRSDNNNIEWLKDLYQQLMKHDNDDDWAVRNYATLCIWEGLYEEAISLYKKLLVDMGEKYYLWSELSNCVQNDNELKIGLLLKALSLERNEDYLGDIHLALAALWIEGKYMGSAKSELKAYAEHRQLKGWRLSDSYSSILNKLSTDTQNGLPDTQPYIERAEDYVYSDFEWHSYVLVERWTNNDIDWCGFTDGDSLSFNVKAKRFRALRKAKLGDVFKWRCRINEVTQPDPKYAAWQHRTIITKEVRPLLLSKTDENPWSTLPIKYGVVDFVNETSHILHILTQDSDSVSCNCTGQDITANSFVKFRIYKRMQNNEERTHVVNLESCPRDEALPLMQSRIVVVDDVNERKQLFHIVLGKGKVSDVVRYDQTEIRPQIGDFLRISYCIKKDKEGKKRIKILDVQTSDQTCNGVKGTVTGRLSVKYRDEYADWENGEPDFAFVKDYYVHRDILRRYQITRDCDVVAKVVLGGDDKWKVYDLEFPNASI